MTTKFNKKDLSTNVRLASLELQIFTYLSDSPKTLSEIRQGFRGIASKETIQNIIEVSPFFNTQNEGEQINVRSNGTATIKFDFESHSNAEVSFAEDKSSKPGKSLVLHEVPLYVRNSLEVTVIQEGVGKWKLDIKEIDKKDGSKKRYLNGNPLEGSKTYIKQLPYFYDSGNKLMAVMDITADSRGYNNGTTGYSSAQEYFYDANGNMTQDKNKGITNIQYNHLNLPTGVQISEYVPGRVEYLYNALGQKVEKLVNQYYPWSHVKTLYLDGFQYQNDQLKFFPHPEGYVKYNPETQKFEYIYNYTDHLGNVRLAYQDKNIDGVIAQTEVLEENNYYPFGLKHSGYNDYPSESAQNNKYKYQYNGKEFQDELGLNWNDYGARNYDPAIGRWMNVDPLGEDMASWSPNNYTFNNPISFTDPDGMAPDNWILTLDNQLVWDTSVNENDYQDFYGKDATFIGKKDYQFVAEDGFNGTAGMAHSDGRVTFGFGTAYRAADNNAKGKYHEFMRIVNGTSMLGEIRSATEAQRNWYWNTASGGALGKNLATAAPEGAAFFAGGEAINLIGKLGKQAYSSYRMWNSTRLASGINLGNGAVNYTDDMYRIYNGGGHTPARTCGWCSKQKRYRGVGGRWTGSETLIYGKGTVPAIDVLNPFTNPLRPAVNNYNVSAPLRYGGAAIGTGAGLYYSYPKK